MRPIPLYWTEILAKMWHMDNKKYMYIFSQKLAGYLMMHGFKLLRINHNLDDDTKNVFVFKNTKMIKDAMNKYKYSTD